MNASWHADHPVPKPATVARRLAWHVARQKHCGCRPTPSGLAATIGGGERASTSTRFFVFNRQLWPYSPYPMFADVDDPHTFETLVLVGEPVDGEEIWFEGQGYLSHEVSPMIIEEPFDPDCLLARRRLLRVRPQGLARIAMQVGRRLRHLPARGHAQF